MGESVLDWVPELWPSFHRPTHLSPLADAFARSSLGQPVRVLSSAPPRFGKSTLIGAAIARHLMLRPQDTVMMVSHAADLAVTKSRMIRDAAVAAGLVLHPDQKRASHWRTAAGGGVIACGVGGGITGHGCNLLVADDLYKGRPEAESQTIRDHVEQWLRGTAMTRVEPNGSIILNSTRWHVDDIQAVLADEGGWTELNIDCYDEAGQSIWPTRWSTEELQRKERQLGSYDFYSQYRGQPRPPGGQVFHGEASTYQWPNIDEGRPIIAVDPATSSKTRADYSVILTAFAYRDESGLLNLDIVDCWRKQAEAPVLIAAIKSIAQYWGNPLIGLEAVAGFKVLVPLLREAGVRRVLELSPTIDKLSRSLPSAAAWESGRIRLPSVAPWLVDFEKEISSFTGLNDKKDDQVDALAHAFAVAGKSIPQRRSGPSRNNTAKWLKTF